MRQTIRDRGRSKSLRASTSAFGILLASNLLYGQTVTVTQTSADQTKLLATLPSTTFGTANTGSYKLQVDATRKYQEWDGVGASMTDSSNWLIWKVLTTDQRNLLMNDLFTTSGAGFNIIRMQMGASDFSASGNYSYDDVPSGQTDPGLTSFSIAHDLPSTIPAAQAAFKANPNIKLFATPWSPPAWMKTTGTMNGGNLLTQYDSTLAQYFVKFIQAYKAEGLPVYAVMPQNEPDTTTTAYPSERFAVSDEANFVSNYLYPALQSSGLGGVKIIGYEHNWTDTYYPETLLSSSAGPDLAGTSYHCYENGDVSAQKIVSNMYPNKGIWFTECTPQLREAWAPSLQFWAETIIINNGRYSGKSAIAWNIALDQNGGPTIVGCDGSNGPCKGIVTIDRSTSPATIIKNVEYYALGQAGRFIRPGAVNIATDSEGPGGIEDVGYLNPDGSIALYVYNSGTAAATISISWSGKFANYSIPSGSVTTFTWASN